MDLWRSYFRNFSYLAVLFVLANLFGYLFHAVSSRKLGPSLYAEFSILYALLLAFAWPINTLSSAVTRVAVTAREAGANFARIERFVTKLGLAMALALGIWPILFYPLLRTFLNIEGFYSFLLIGVTLFLWSISGVIRGLLSSIEAFGIISSTGIFELFVRAIFGILLVLLGMKVFGAIVSSTIGAFFVLALLVKQRPLVESAYNKGKQTFMFKENLGKITLNLFLMNLPVGFFIELDRLLAKRFFLQEAGIYSASALIGKEILIFSGLASSVVYPKLIKERLSEKGIRVFLWGVGITIISFGFGYLFIRFFGSDVIGLLFGDKYSAVVDLTPFYIVALIPLACHLQVISYKGAVGGWIEGNWLWFVLAAYYLALELCSSTLDNYLKTIFLFHLAFAPASLLVLYLRERRYPPKRTIPKSE